MVNECEITTNQQPALDILGRSVRNNPTRSVQSIQRVKEHVTGQLIHQLTCALSAPTVKQKHNKKKARKKARKREPKRPAAIHIGYLILFHLIWII